LTKSAICDTFFDERNYPALGSAGWEGARLFEKPSKPQPGARVRGREKFFIFFGHNLLKSPDSEKLMKINESKFAFVFFSLACLFFPDIRALVVEARGYAGRGRRAGASGKRAQGNKDGAKEVRRL
jgi:hypothetical protein